jgi:hypothetical protein
MMTKTMAMRKMKRLNRRKMLRQKVPNRKMTKNKTLHRTTHTLR